MNNKEILIKKIMKLEFLQMIISAVVNLADDVLLVAGAVLISRGVFLIHVPAGYITSGICCIAFAFFIAKRR